MRGVLAMVIATGVLTACSSSPGAGRDQCTPSSPPSIEIPQAPDQPISDREKLTDAATIDLDAIAERGYLRILVAPSRTHFETVDGRHHGRAVDAGVALTRAISEQTAKDVKAVFIATREDRLVPDLLAGKGDVAANVLLTFARDEQVAFAPPIKTGIREVVVTGTDRPSGQPRRRRRQNHSRPQGQRSSREPDSPQRTTREDQSSRREDRRRDQAAD